VTSTSSYLAELRSSPKGGMNDRELHAESSYEPKKKTNEERELESRRELKEKLKTLLVNVELLPRELIFIGRAMRILQANNQAMGEYSLPPPLAC
jgi:aarF domain-containing kinase